MIDSIVEFSIVHTYINQSGKETRRQDYDKHSKDIMNNHVDKQRRRHFDNYKVLHFSILCFRSL